MLTMAFVAMALALGLDQASKAVVIRRLAEGQSAGPLGSPVRLYRLSNARPGLGFVVSRRAWLLLWGCIALMVAMLSLTRAGGDPIGPLGLGLALGGATGNLLDRLGRGAVVDFIDLRVWNLRIWPVFNLADVAIVGGAMLALWSLR